MTSRFSIIPSPIAALVMAVVCAVPVAAADPSNRVARISVLSGPVSVRPFEDADWQAAVLNFPMVAGDGVWTDNSGRAELELGPTVIRLGPNTSLNFLTLDDRTIQLRLTQGTVNVSVRSLDADEAIEVDMPNAAASVQAEGFYRFDVGFTGEQSTVTARQGRADVISGGSALAVTEKQSVVVTGFSPPVPALRAAVASDEWEDWCQSRERRAASRVSSRYVSPYTVGYDDLDQFGVWQVNATYGPVWIPQVATGWTPYGFGHWVWVSPWGWTWVDDAPWGFAPFHYGRWVSVNRTWCWVPGDRIARPIYAPALVVFLGGPGFASFGEPVGWFPLGPREVFVPTYTVSPTYVRAINAPHVHVTNVTNVTHVTNVQINVTNIHYVNRSAPNAVTVVTRRGFLEGRPVRSVLAQTPEQALRAATPLAAPVAPRPPRSVTSASALQKRPPDQVLNRPVVLKNRAAGQVGTIAPVAKGSPPSVVREAAPAAKVAPPSVVREAVPVAKGSPPSVVREAVPAAKGSPPSVVREAAPVAKGPSPSVVREAVPVAKGPSPSVVREAAPIAKGPSPSIVREAAPVAKGPPSSVVREAAPAAKGPPPSVVPAVAPARPPVANQPTPRPPEPSPPLRSQFAPEANPRAVEMNVRPAAERADLEARRAAEQAQLQQRQKQEAPGAANDPSPQDVLRRQQQIEASQAQARQTRGPRDGEQRQRVLQQPVQLQQQAQPQPGQTQSPPQTQPQPPQVQEQPQHDPGRGQSSSAPPDNGDSGGRGRGRGGK